MSVAGPETAAPPVEELPERLVCAGQQTIGELFRGSRTGDACLDLGGETPNLTAEVESNVDRENVFEPQAGKQAGLQERGLPQPGLAEEDGQRLVSAENFCPEKLFVLLARPGGVDVRAGGHRKLGGRRVCLGSSVVEPAL